ncbi:hypothetical protein JCM11251_003053 [Rhodosporidiobolus azoricus]
MSGNSDPRPAPASVPPPRVIPGLSVLSGSPSLNPPKPSRKRSKKPAGGPALTGTVGENGAATGADAEKATKEGKDKVGEELTQEVKEEDLSIEEKKTNPVEVVQKRLRAATKKLQRIEGYEKQEAALNADQKRAIEGKGILEAVIRELNEVLVVLKAEEQEDEARAKRVAVVEEKRTAKAVDAAVKASKADSQQSLVLLFQFLHLHSLFNPSETSFAPPVLPPIVASATGQDAAAVRMLFDQFANGPLLGGQGDAVEKLEKIAKGGEEELLPGVSFSRIQQLIHGLTAPPEDTPASPLASSVDLDKPAKPSDSVIALVDGDEGDAHAAAASAGLTSNVSFLQPSEVEGAPASPSAPGGHGVIGDPAPSSSVAHQSSSHPQPPVDSLPLEPPSQKVQSWADEIAEEATVPPPSGPATPAADIVEATFIQQGNGMETPTQSAATPVTEVPPEQPIDWSAEDAEGDTLPHLPELAPPVPVIAGATPSAPAGAAPAANGAPNNSQNNNDGFQEQHRRRPSGQQQGGGGRGSFRGGRGGGGFRGRGRGGFAGQQGEGGSFEGRPPRPERGDSEGGRGGFRGGRGRGGFRGGRGRGGANGQQQYSTGPAPPPTA